MEGGERSEEGGEEWREVGGVKREEKSGGRWEE